MKHDHYTYRVIWSEEDRDHVGLCAEFARLSWLEPNPEKALAGIRKLVTDCVNDMEQSGETIPPPLAEKNFSGRFMVRAPPQLHRTLATQATEAGISLNRLVSHKLAR